MRSRERILGSLESAYREAFERAEKSDDADAMARMDFDFQRDQILLEVLLDVRTALSATLAQTSAPAPAQVAEQKEKGTSLLEKAQTLRKLKNLTKLR